MSQLEDKHLWVTHGKKQSTKILDEGASPGIGKGPESIDLRPFRVNIEGQFHFRSNPSMPGGIQLKRPSDNGAMELVLGWQRQNDWEISNIPATVGAEVSKTVATLPPPVTEVERLKNEISALTSLIDEKTAKITERIEAAGRVKSVPHVRIALTIKLLAASVDYLNERLADTQGRLRAEELAIEEKLEAEKQREREIEQAAAQQAADEAARKAAEEQQRLETERQQQSEAEQAAAQQAADEAARKAAEEQQRLETERQQQSEAEQAAAASVLHSAPAAVAAARPFVFDTARLYPVAASTGEALLASLRTGASWAASLAAGTGSGLVVGVTALLYPSKLEAPTLVSKPVAASFPLELSAPELAQRLTEAREAVEARQAAEMPLRLTVTAVGQGSEKIGLAVVKPSVTVPATVKVVHATHDPATGNYTAQTAEQPPRTLVWTPAINPPDASTTLPAETVEPGAHEGPAVEPVELQVLELPVAEPVEIDDLIIVFPIDSGMAPIYVMYVSPRYLPGIATGVGRWSSDDWISDAAKLGFVRKVLPHTA